MDDIDLAPEEQLTPGQRRARARNLRRAAIQEVRVVDFDIPFFNLMWFMVKAAVASIPAAAIAGLIFGLAVAFPVIMLAGLGRAVGQ